jgi:hypothetical protein
MQAMKLYENKAHQRMCALRFIHPQQLHSQRQTEGAGPPPHCTCMKPIPSLVRLNQIKESLQRGEG